MSSHTSNWLPDTEIISGYGRIHNLAFSSLILVVLVLLGGCRKDPTIPVLTTDQASEITAGSVSIGGNITDDGGAEVTARGICWGTSPSPAMEDNFKPSGTGTGSFNCLIEGLEPNTQYYARAYAQNNVGLAYGNEIEFITGVASPEVATTQVSDVTATVAICGGEIVSDGGASITEKGICWSTSPDPDLNDMHASSGTGSQIFSCSMTNLLSGTLYYVRAYAKNDVNTAYGEAITFYTKVSDIEGNLYSVVSIGDQLWMTENLKTTRLNDNTLMPDITDGTEWVNTSTPAYCWYDNNVANKSVYGALYNWYAVGSGKLCPVGWHVPTDDEFFSLEQTLGMASDQLSLWGWRGTDQGSKMKNNTGWDDGGNGTNSSGFSALPGGYRFGVDGSYYLLTTITYWWTATEHDADRGWYRRLDSSSGQVYRASTSKKGGKYVRCVKN